MGRRGNGEGSVRQRSDGRWECRVWLPDRSRVSVYGETRAEVTEAAARILRESRGGVRVLDGRQTYAEYLATWLDGKRGKVKLSTWVSTDVMTRLHIIPVIGAVRLCDLAPYHLERALTLHRASGHRASQRLVAVLSSSLRAAVRHGLVARNVAALMERPTSERREFRALDPEEARRYLAVAGSPDLTAFSRERRVGVRHHGLFLTVLLATGLRVGELQALRWRDVQLTPKDGEDPCLRVNRSLNWWHRDPVISTPKTQHSKRKVLLTPQAIEALQQWRQTQREYRLRAGALWRTTIIGVSAEQRGQAISLDDLVFTNELGLPNQRMTIRRAHHRICREAGLPPIRIHDLRHTCATLLLSQGVSPKVVSAMLGHTTIAMTLDIYSHILPSMQREAIAALARVLTEPTAPSLIVGDSEDPDQTP